jgi:hypothetical protein
MRRLLLALVVLVCAAVPARAQNCVTVNGITRCAMPWQVYDTAQRVVSTPVLDLRQTWNQITTTFTGVQLNVTDTNSASGSLLLDLQVGGTSKFSVTKGGAVVAASTFTPTGVIKAPDGAQTAPSYTFASDATTGMYLKSGAVYFATGGTDRWFISSGGVLGSQSDNGWGIGASNANRPSTVFLAGPAITPGSGTGITLNSSGELRTQTYKITIASTAFICAAVTCDVTIATLPAKTFVTHAMADLTQTFACASTCTTATLSFTLGKTAGGNEYLLSVDADAATGQFGRTAATLGASLAPATAQTLIGDNASWASTTAVVMRMTSGTGNIGTGAATNFSGGSVTFYLTTVLPQ